LKKSKAAVLSVLPGSIAEEAGIEPGDVIVSVNGEKVRDIFDYRFLTADSELLLELRKKDGETWEIEIEKDEYEDLGIEFNDYLMDDVKKCGNKCIFCFIDQLPAGMRESLYFKDDDLRLSFLMGNYVTLTNVKSKEIKRVIKYKMSPINISVHTTDPELRKFMMGSRFAGDILDKIGELAGGGITVNSQVVVCRGVNDGGRLDDTISDLAAFYPGLKSISVVPAGITKHRDGLYRLEEFDALASEEIIFQVERWQKRFLEAYGSRIVYPADEFYLMAGYELPEYEEYEDFPQLENGVGMIALFKREFREHLDSFGLVLPEMREPRNISVATGVSAGKYIAEMAETLEKKYAKLKVNVYEIKNDFFGENVTVAGLLTGRDIIRQLSGKALGDELLISRCMLKAGETLLLDGYSVEMLEGALGVKVTPVANTGGDFADNIIGRKSG